MSFLINLLWLQVIDDFGKRVFGSFRLDRSKSRLIIGFPMRQLRRLVRKIAEALPRRIEPDIMASLAGRIFIKRKSCLAHRDFRKPDAVRRETLHERVRAGVDD